MADFSTIKAKRTSVNNAYSLLDYIRNTYSAAKQAQALLTLYQAGTDATFNAAVNALFTAAQRTELASMANDLQTLTTAWELTHASAIKE